MATGRSLASGLVALLPGQKAVPLTGEGLLSSQTHLVCHYKYKQSFPRTRESMRSPTLTRRGMDSRVRGNDSHWFFGWRKT